MHFKIKFTSDNELQTFAKKSTNSILNFRGEPYD